MKNLTLLLIALLFTGLVKSEDKTFDWRFDRSGKYLDETNLLKTWPEDGPKLLWQIDSGLGLGYSSPMVTDKYIFIAGMIDSTGHMFCYTLDGKLKWDVSYGKSWNKKSFPGARSTPVFHNGALYSLSGHGLAFKMDAETGEILWSLNIAEKYNAEAPRFGFCESPLIVDDNVIFTPGGEKVALVALNQEDGSVVWEAPGRGDISGYCSAIFFEHNQRKVIATMTFNYLIGIDYETGDSLWTFHSYENWTDNSNSPIYKNGELFITSPYGEGSRMFKLNENGSAIELKWHNKDFDNQIGGTVEVNDYIYGLTIKKKQWMCVDRETGETKWAERGLKPGSIIYADGMLYCYGDDGMLALVEPSPETFKIVSQFQPFDGKQQFTHPVISNGKLYIRYQEGLKVFNIAE